MLAPADLTQCKTAVNVVGCVSTGRGCAERVAATGRPLGRAGDLARYRMRFAEHPSGLVADRTRAHSDEDCCQRDGCMSTGRGCAERVAATGRPLGRGGDLARYRMRFAEHPSGLVADRTRAHSDEDCGPRGRGVSTGRGCAERVADGIRAHSDCGEKRCQKPDLIQSRATDEARRFARG
jgi:hypothetical protein